MHPGKPTPKAPPLALPPTLISGRCHVSSLRPSLPFLGPPFSRPAPPRPCSLRVPGPPPPGGARPPGTQRRRWGLGGAEERLFLESDRGGEGQLGEVPHPRPPSRAWEGVGLQRRGTQGNNGDDGEGERAPPDKGPPSPAPGVSSFLQVLRFTPSKEAQQGSGTGVGGGSWTDPGDTLPTCVASPSSRCSSKAGTSLPPVSAAWEASSGFLTPIREALRTRAWPRLCSSLQSKQASDSPRREEGFAGQGCVSCSGALPTEKRETEAPGKAGHAGGEEALRPVPHRPLRLHTGLTLHCQALLDGAQVVQGAGPFGTSLFLMLLHWRKSPCSFQRV